MPTKSTDKKKPATVKKPRAPRKKKIAEVQGEKKTESVAEKPKVHEKKNYLFAVGRRKSSVARVRYYTSGNGEITVNNKPLTVYFPYFEFQQQIRQPLILTQQNESGSFSVKVNGGGKRGQAEATRLGISRALLLIDAGYRPILKSQDLLTRDPREKERKKYGLKKARRAPQWQKR